jgi:hypothetical protein
MDAIVQARDEEPLAFEVHPGFESCLGDFAAARRRVILGGRELVEEVPAMEELAIIAVDLEKNLQENSSQLLWF